MPKTTADENRDTLQAAFDFAQASFEAGFEAGAKGGGSWLTAWTKWLMPRIVGQPPSHTLPSGAFADWSGATSVPPVCAGCGLPITPTVMERGGAPTSHTKYFGTKGPYHIGCYGASDAKP